MVSRAEEIQSRLRWLWSKRGFRRAAIILGVIHDETTHDNPLVEPAT
jgi:hypothetical protein